MKPGDADNFEMIIAEQVPPLVKAVEHFDTVNETVYGGCASYYNKPTKGQDLAISCHASVVAFEMVLESISKSEPIEDERYGAIASLIHTEDKKLVDTLNLLSNSEEFKSIPIDIEALKVDITNMAKYADEAGEDLLGNISEEFADILRKHMIHFTYLAELNYKESRLERTARVLGKHVLDISKITTGVTVALWIYNLKR